MINQSNGPYNVHGPLVFSYGAYAVLSLHRGTQYGIFVHVNFLTPRLIDRPLEIIAFLKEDRALFTGCPQMD